jgi:MoaA/NifB/PqqE/SkfB family radical SAM enzyme
MTKKTNLGGMPVIITGWRQSLLRIGYLWSILMVALRTSESPVLFYRACRYLLRLRKNLYSNFKLTKIARSGGRWFYSIHVPAWPSKTFDAVTANMIRTNLEKGLPIANQTIFFAITSRCPLACSHCYEWNNLCNEETLTFEQLLVIFRKIEDQGIRHMQISGGEPLARFDDLLALMKSARYPTDFWILTSGYGLDSEKARQLKEAGLTGVAISLDHWDEAGHNAVRNNPMSFHWAHEAAKACLEQGIVVSFGVCPMKEFITPENLRRYYELCQSWGASFVRILEPRTVGRLSNSDLVLTTDQIAVLEDFYLSSLTDKRWKNFPVVIYPGYNQRRVGCMGAGERYLYIDARGEFKPCPFCDKSYGNALTTSFDEVISRMMVTGCHNL